MPDNPNDTLDEFLKRAADAAVTPTVHEWLLGLRESEECASSEEGKSVELTAKK